MRGGLAASVFTTIVYSPHIFLHWQEGHFDYSINHDFRISKSFYAALGFELTEGWGGTMDCRLGGAVFRLQNCYVKDWAENFMMKFYVEDVQEWFEHIKKVLDENKYSNARIAEPEMIGDTEICHVWDPCGFFLSLSNEKRHSNIAICKSWPFARLSDHQLVLR